MDLHLSLLRQRKEPLGLLHNFICVFLINSLALSVSITVRILLPKCSTVPYMIDQVKEPNLP